MRISGCVIDVLGRVSLGIVAASMVAFAHPMLPFGGNAAVTPEAIRSGAPRPASFADLAQKVSPAVISVSVRLEDGPGGRGVAGRRNGRSGGSGFFISADGYAVTNAHVIKPDNTVPLSAEIRTAAGDIYDAKVVGLDPLTDLALIKVTGRGGFPFVAFAETLPRVGDWVIAIGSPFGLDSTVTTGIVSAADRDIGYGDYDFIQIDAPTNPGSSGGPAFDLDGKVVGVNTAIWQTPGDSGGFLGIGFAVPADIARKIVAQLEERGSVTRGWIGVPVQPVTPDVAGRLGLKRATGALVGARRLDASGIIKPDDIITTFNDQPVQDPRDLARKAGAIAPGASVKLGVLRGSEERIIAVKLRNLADQAQLPNGAASGKPRGKVANADPRRNRTRSN
jgi:serine protease Do